jgi:hypothetical protein
MEDIFAAMVSEAHMVMRVKGWVADSAATGFYTPIGENINRDNW